MVPFSAFTDQFAGISAQVSAEQSTFSGFLHSAAPWAQPEPTGPHFPGLLLSAGFNLMQAAYFQMLVVGVVEKLRGGETLVPASMTFELTDNTGGASVGAAGASIAGAVFGN
ncbi:hypothetical protein ACWDT6_26800 [Nocardia grenadensis]|uniref:hypothetical protein n=1 Tax=Nocardia grenadensis TaxID=931537 RepID=UPI003D71AD3B